MLWFAPTAGLAAAGLAIPAQPLAALSLASHVEGLGRAIQMSVAPVFLLTGLGGLLVVLTNRLARIIDRARQMQDKLQGTALAISRENRLELKVQKQRMALVLKAIELCTLTILLVAIVVAVVFISAVTAIDLAQVVVPLFVLAMVCLMAASVLFLREVQLAARQIRRWF
jgi:hypothetical protein